MKSSLIILDDIVDNFDELQKNLLELLNGSGIRERWYNLDTEHPCADICLHLINVARRYYNLDNCSGYEFWLHNNSRPSKWHIDKDERMKHEKGILSFPLCTMVYYIFLDNVTDGKLELRDVIIEPKNNRLIMFPSGIEHYVQPFSGKRVSLVVNPWDGSKYSYPIT